MADYTIKRNDTWPPLAASLGDSGGSIDLTDATRVHILLTSDAVRIRTAAVDITDAAGGDIAYQWTSDDTRTSGTYRMEIEITWSNGTIQTIPNDGYLELLIVDDLG